MDALEALVRCLPDQAECIRRRFWRDPEFRSMCQDFRDAMRAQAEIEAQRPAASARAEEYRQLAAEILVEVTELLKKGRSR